MIHISKTLRTLIIIHLCAVFTFLVWEGVYAFSKDSLALKAKVNLYEKIFDETQSEYRSLLPDAELAYLKTSFEDLKSKERPGFFQKILEVVHVYAFEISPWFQAWAFFSIISCLCLLFRIKGAAYALWVLPITILGYTYFHHYKAPLHNISTPAGLPTEEFLVKQYLKRPLRNNLKQQKEDLEKSWELYLIDRWAHETPNTDSALYQKQVEKGQFFFLAANLSQEAPHTFASFTSPLFSRAPLLLLIPYFLWNFFFSIFVTIKALKRPQQRHHPSR